MKFLERQSSLSAIIMEEGDYNLSPSKVRGMHVDYIFIPKDEYEKYSTDLLNQLHCNISIEGIYFGKILTYETNI